MGDNIEPFTTELYIDGVLIKSSVQENFEILVIG